MKAASYKEIEEIKRYYEDAKKQGASDLKAAYLAAAAFGFVTIAATDGINIKLLNENDNTFIIVSYSEKEVEKVIREKQNIVLFHLDSSIISIK